VQKNAGFISMRMIAVREVEPEDSLPLADTLPGGFLHTTRETWLQRFENWWALNPAFTSGLPRGWMLEEDERILGFIGNIPVRFLVRGEMKLAAAAAAWYVDPSVRGLTSMKLFNEYLKQSEAALFLFKTEDRNLAKVLLKYGYKEYPCLSQPVEYLHTINRAQLVRENNLKVSLSRYFHRGEVRSLAGLSAPMRNIFKLAYLYIFNERSDTIGDLSKGAYTSSLCTHCDDSFTRLWDQHLQSYDVAMSRDTSTLNWLYFVAGRRYNRTVIQCRRTSDTSLAGYMVFDFPPGKAAGGGFMKLMDMRILNNDPQVLASLISCAIEVGRQNSAPLLRLWADSPEADSLLRERFRVQWPAEKFSLIRLSESLETEADTARIFSCLINPPWGIDH
jgi:hypothetical protein